MKRELFYFDHKPKLNEEYRKAFDEIEEYCRLEIMSSESFEDSMDYLMDIFLTAQDKGMPVKKITGGNMESFCKGFISDVACHSTFSRILEIIKTIAWTSIFYTLIFIIAPQMIFDRVGLFEVLSRNSEYWFGALIGIVGGVIAGIAADMIYKQIIFKLKKYRRFYQILLNLICIIICVCVIIIIPLDDNMDFNLSNGALLAVYVGILICCGLIRGFINKANGKPFFGKQEQGEKETTFTENIMHNMVTEFRKKYENGNAKLEKKGKTPLSQEEFTEKIYKDTAKDKKITVISCALTLLFYIGMIIYTAFNSTIFDTVIFAVLLSVIYIIIMWPLAIYPCLIRKRFVNILQKNDKTVFDEDIWDYLK